MTEKKPRTSRPDASGRAVQWSHAVPGFLLGFLTYFVADEFLGGIVLLPDWVMHALTGLAYAGLALTNARRLQWWASAAVCVAYVVLGWTPLFDGTMRGWVRVDPPQRADAAVVLSSDVRADGKPYRVGQVRLLAGYEIVGSGLSPVLVLTKLAHPRASMTPYVEEQLDALGIEVEVLETPETVRNTRDEARAVAAMAQRRGWKRVIVVTDSMHLRRAGALFEREGLEVIRRPCLEDDFDLSALRAGKERLTALRSWSHEVVGWNVYRMRGWLD